MVLDVFENKRILITGGTGSLGHALLEKLILGEYGRPKKVTIFSRDEAKQHAMRVNYAKLKEQTEEIIYYDFRKHINFIIGDIRDFSSVTNALQDIDIVIHAAALKQVPVCEYFVHEACLTNIIGAVNIVKAIETYKFPIETVVGVTTDKACLPVNVMGMTKALQERVFISANIKIPNTKFICVRYGNVLASRGSVIPLFHEQIKNGGPITVTTKEMTRFFLPLMYAVTTIAHAIKFAFPGETYVPKLSSAKIWDIATILVEKKKIDINIVGIRPGEKVHEVMVSVEEGFRTYERGNFLVIESMLPELSNNKNINCYGKEYSSKDYVMTFSETKHFLKEFNLINLPSDKMYNINRLVV